MKKKLFISAALVLLVGLTLSISAEPPLLHETAKGAPFIWNQQLLWESLEKQFVLAKGQSCEDLQQQISQGFEQLGTLIAQTAHSSLTVDHPVWAQIEQQMMSLAPMLAACPEQLQQYMQAVQNIHTAVKQQAVHWAMASPETRHRLYRLIYGGRSAVEEIMLQASSGEALMRGSAEPSQSPSIEFKGLTLHSGDILVSRGGAATSALIARGSDYPGNFSHAALLHIDPQTKAVSIIEALIEAGVVVTSLDDYLADKKLRIMVLRMRSDSPALKKNPTLAHQAAAWALSTSRGTQLRYDFEMDYHNHEQMFCSEVVYAAYEQQGVHLWLAPSSISELGTARWLAAFGVTHFNTIEPSDLEYDPQLVKVAEWRDPQTLFKDHVDNAATDVLIEGANKGEPLAYNALLLPLARVVKGYSYIKNRFGSHGTVPEGMSATAALRNRWYTNRHAVIVEGILASAEDFQAKMGYRPPFWVLVQLAQEVKDRR